MTIPYATATSGAKARDEVVKMLRVFGCESVGFMDDFENGAVILAFKHRGRPVQLRASAQGWAAMYLKAQNYKNHRSQQKIHDDERKAIAQGLIAVNSILRDWVKGQITAVETGMLSFNAVFLPYMLASDGRPVVEHLMQSGLVPALEDKSNG
jgi:hypothetical protein